MKESLEKTLNEDDVNKVVNTINKAKDRFKTPDDIIDFVENTADTDKNKPIRILQKAVDSGKDYLKKNWESLVALASLMFAA